MERTIENGSEESKKSRALNARLWLEAIAIIYILVASSFRLGGFVSRTRFCTDPLTGETMSQWTMKTILQLVQEHIAKQAALVGDPTKLQTNAHEALQRMQRRYEQDPALVMLPEHYDKALMRLLPMIPWEMKTSTAQGVIVQVIQYWEDVHKSFEEQLRPSMDA